MEIEELKLAIDKIYESIDTYDSFKYPNSKDKLFDSTKEFWQLNAWIDKRNGIRAYSIGYLDAAKLLSRIIIFSQRHMDTLVYPMIYLYRHYIEIKLKDLIVKGAEIQNQVIDEKVEEILRNHNLMNLWNSFKPALQEISGHNDSFDEVKKGMESYINQIHEIDPASFTFRYDRSRDKKRHSLEKHEHINILHFCQNIEKLTDILEGISGEFSDALDYVNEMRSSYSDY